MAKNIFITATNTNVGKTYTTLKLIEYFSKKGYKIGVFKPIETGVQDIPEDGQKLFEKVREFREVDFGLDEVVPVRFSLPASPVVCGKVDFEKIDKAYKKIAKNSDIVLIEGAGGIMVPVTQNFIMYDFAKRFNAKILLVVQSKLGCINDLNLNLEFLKNDEFEWVINLFDESFYRISYPYLSEKFDEVHILQDDLDKIAKKLLENQDE